MAEWFHVRREAARSILSRTTGFIAQAGFSHSLTPARNCTFGCTYCYVPTMRIYAGLRPEDWRRWGQFTTFKSNSPELAARDVRGDERIYCSPLVDPYQPAEQTDELMPRLLCALIERPPALFTIQTRGPLILRDLDLLCRLNEHTRLRVSFSVTTNREEVRRWYEPHCAPFSERLHVIRRLTSAGIKTYATLAPILPCDPTELAQAALEASLEDIPGDPFHSRLVKRHGASTRPQAEKVSAVHQFSQWHDPTFQSNVVDTIARVVAAEGRRFAVGPEAFGWLAQ